MWYSRTIPGWFSLLSTRFSIMISLFTFGWRLRSRAIFTFSSCFSANTSFVFLCRARITREKFPAPMSVAAMANSSTWGFFVRVLTARRTRNTGQAMCDCGE